MSLESIIMALIAAASIPSAITGFCFWSLQRRIEKRDKELEEKEKAKEENELLLIKLAGASLSLLTKEEAEKKLEEIFEENK